MLYDVFLSYSRKADDKIAPALRAGLQAVGKPWYRRRAMRVFLDRTSLSANPALWPSIASALENSRFLVLLCSPAAASSPWVEREVQFWIASKSAANLILALTDGELVWLPDQNRFDSTGTNALPRSLLAAYSEEPRWVDFRWARPETEFSLKHPRFLEAAVEIAAPVRGLSKEDLAGEEVRQHRRTVRTAWSAAASLVLLFVTAAVLAALFARRGVELNAQFLESERGRLAAQLELGRRLVTEGLATRAFEVLSEAGQDPSALLTPEALALNFEVARAAFLTGETGSFRFASKRLDEDDVALDVAGRFVAARKMQTSSRPEPEDNKVEFWDARCGERTGTVFIDPGTRATDVVFTRERSVAAISVLDQETLVVDPRNGTRLAAIPKSDIHWIDPVSARAFDYNKETGALTAYTLASGEPSILVDGASGARLRRFELSETGVAAAVYSDDSLTLSLPDQGGATRRLVESESRPGLDLVGFSAEGDRLWLMSETIPLEVMDVATGTLSTPAGVDLDEPPAQAAALAHGGVAYVSADDPSDLMIQSLPGEEPTRISLREAPEEVAAGPVPGGVLVAYGGGEIDWVTADEERDPILLAGPDDRLTALAGSVEVGIVVAGHASGEIRVWRVGTGTLTSVFSRHDGEIAGLALSRDARQLLSASLDGTVREWQIQPTNVDWIVSPRRWGDADKLEEEATKRRISAANNQDWLALREDDRTIGLWTNRGKQEARLQLEERTVEEFGFSADSKFLLAIDDHSDLVAWSTDDGTRIEWLGDVAPQVTPQTLGTEGRQRELSSEVVLAPSGPTFLAQGSDYLVHLWDLSERRPIDSFDFESRSYSVGAPPLATRAAFVPEPLVWNGAEELLTRDPVKRSLRDALDLAPGEKVVGLQIDTQQVVLRAQSGSCLVTRVPRRAQVTPLEGECAEGGRVFFSDHGQCLAIGVPEGLYFKQVAVWTHSGSRRAALGREGSDAVFAKVLLDSRCSRILTLDAQIRGRWTLWDAESGEAILVMEHRHADAQFSPDGSRLLVVSNLSNEGAGGVWLRDSQTGKVLWEAGGWMYDPSGVGFSPDGRFVVAYSRSADEAVWHEAWLIDAVQGQVVADLNRSAGRVVDLSFGSPGTALFGLASDGAVARWDLFADSVAVRSHLGRVLADRKEKRLACKSAQTPTE